MLKLNSFIASLLTLFSLAGQNTPAQKEFYTQQAIQSILIKSEATPYIVLQYHEHENDTVPFTTIPQLVREPSGVEYQIYPYGGLTKSTYFNYSPDQLSATKDYQVTFSADPNQTYGFDAMTETEWHENYEIILLSDSSNYKVPWKSIVVNETDAVKATLISEGSEPITFKDGNGNNISATANGNEYELQLSGFSQKGEYVIYAYSGQEKLGKLNLHVYEEKERLLTVVPMSTGQNLSKSAIETQLNSIFGAAGFKWEVTIGDAYTDTAWDLNSDNQLQTGETSTFTKYSEEMRQLRDLWLAAHPDFDKENYLIFAVPSFDDNQVEGNMQGYMVRGKKLGFIAQNDSAKTLPHELGHGAFGLKHTFDEVEKNSTDNLLDYGSGEHLAVHQWGDMRSWVPVVSFLDGEDDNMIVSQPDFQDVVINEKFGIPFPNGRYYKVKDLSTVEFNHDGLAVNFVREVNGQTIQYDFLITESISGGTRNIVGLYSNIEKDTIEEISYGSALPSNSALRTQLFNIEQEFFNDFLTPVVQGDSIVTRVNKKVNGYPLECKCNYAWEFSGNVVNHQNLRGEMVEGINIGDPFSENTCTGTSCDESLYDGVAQGFGMIYYDYAHTRVGENELDSLKALCNYLSSQSFQLSSPVNLFMRAIFYENGNYFVNTESQPQLTLSSFFGNDPSISTSIEPVYRTINNDAFWSLLKSNSIKTIGGLFTKFLEVSQQTQAIDRTLLSEADEFFYQYLQNNSETFKNLGRSPHDTYVDYHFDIELQDGVSSEFSVRIDALNMEEDEIKDIFLNWKLPIGYSYDYYLWYWGLEDTWTNYGQFWDNYRLKEPPLLVNMLASFVLGPANFFYGLYTGTDIVTGEELQGWEHCLNSLDLIPVIGAFSELGSAGVKTFKVVKSGTTINVKNIFENLPVEVLDLAKKIGNNTSRYGLVISSNASDVAQFINKTTREVVFEVENGVIEVLNWSNKTAGTVVGKIKGKFKKGNTTVNTERELVKNGDEVYVRMEVGDELASGGGLGTLIDDAVLVVTKNENLPDWIKKSFKNGNYVTVQTKQKITVYRDFGNKAFMDGSFSTTVNNATRNELALHQSFENSMRFKSTIEVPSGEILDIGKVGPYPPGNPNALPGGADQVLLPEKYSHSWIKEIIDTQTGNTYSVETFKSAFPNLIKTP